MIMMMMIMMMMMMMMNMMIIIIIIIIIIIMIIAATGSVGYVLFCMLQKWFPYGDCPIAYTVFREGSYESDVVGCYLVSG